MQRLKAMWCAALCVVLVMSFSGCSEQEKLDPFSPQHGDYINYNNYVNDGDYFGTIDYRDGVLVYDSSRFIPKVVAVDETGEEYKVSGVMSPFQLSENGVVYQKFSKLMYRDQNGNEMAIAENPSRFSVYNSLVIYECIPKYDNSTSEYLNDDLYGYDIQTGQTEVLFEDPGEYVVYEDCLYVTESGFDPALYKVSLDTRKKQFITQLDISGIPYTFQVSNDTLVMYGIRKDFYLLDLNTLKESALPMFDGWCDVVYVCEGSTIYFSYRGMIQDGSFNYTDDENEHNGTWKMNMQTGKIERISNDYYDKLYCFDQTHLYGYSFNSGLTEIQTV